MDLFFKLVIKKNNEIYITKVYYHNYSTVIFSKLQIRSYHPTTCSLKPTNISSLPLTIKTQTLLWPAAPARSGHPSAWDVGAPCPGPTDPCAPASFSSWTRQVCAVSSCPQPLLLFPCESAQKLPSHRGLPKHPV